MQITVPKGRSLPLRAALASSRVLRSLALPLMRQFDFQITIKNPFSGLRFHLLSFTHKGYWFYGRHRERDSMARCARLMQKGGHVFEVGGHIGYLSQFFAHRTGAEGQVHIFEPGQQNQKFLRMNIASCQQCVHVNAAVSDFTGKATFYEENLGGFMNSLDEGFAQSTDNAGAQHRKLKLQPRRVNTTTLDAYAISHDVWPHFLKIDVEGAELAVLRGASRVLNNARSVMIEVTRNQLEIFNLLGSHGFHLSHPKGCAIISPDQMRGNVFATRED